jgi:hypothetical protein
MSQIRVRNGIVHTFPDNATDEQIDAFMAKQEAPAQAQAPAPTRSRVAQAIEGGLSKATDVLGTGLAYAGALGTPNDDQRALGRTIASWVLPQDTLGAGITLGTMLLGGPAAALAAKAGAKALPYFGQTLANIVSKPALARMASAAVGGEVGAQVEGDRATGAGALEGATQAGLGEVAGRLGSAVVRAMPGGKGRVAAKDAARVGEAIEQIVPTLKGARTANDLRLLAAGEGKRKLGDMKEQAIREIEGMLPPDATIPVPLMMSQKPMPAPYVPHVNPGGYTPGGYPGTPPIQPPKTPDVSLRSANDYLTELGESVFSKAPVDRTHVGKAGRELYKETNDQIRQGLNVQSTQAAETFRGAQDQYSEGLALLKLLMNPRNYMAAGNDVQFNLAHLQQKLGDPRVLSALQNKLPPEKLDQFIQAVTRGGTLGVADVPTPGAGHMTEALQKILRVGGGFGTTATLPVRTLLPNAGARYAGLPSNLPYALPAEAQMALDVLTSQVNPIRLTD